MRSETNDPTSNQFAVITRMLGYLCISTEAEASLVRKVQILDKFSLGDGEIARICGSGTQSVRNARQLLKKKTRGKKKK